MENSVKLVLPSLDLWGCLLSLYLSFHIITMLTSIISSFTPLLKYSGENSCFDRDARCPLWAARLRSCNFLIKKYNCGYQTRFVAISRVMSDTRRNRKKVDRASLRKFSSPFIETIVRHVTVVALYLLRQCYTY